MQPNDSQDQNGWSFRPEGETATVTGGVTQAEPQGPTASHDPVSWTGSEFIAHHKSVGWYIGIILGFILIAIPIYYFTRDIITIVSITIVLILFLIVGSSKPRQRAYIVDNQGVSIGDKFYPYSVFKSFAVMQEGAISSINLMPLKRFMPEISIYYPPEEEERIIDVLMNSLPNEQRNEKITDRLAKQIRF